MVQVRGEGSGFVKEVTQKTFFHCKKMHVQERKSASFFDTPTEKMTWDSNCNSKKAAERDHSQIQAYVSSKPEHGLTI